ncbi:MAG TPA: pitrilysin family protein [Gemmatimonadaceae bacterium]|nr:pitrilysin family protein [Gemmatimonadaceae bacterium]
MSYPTVELAPGLHRTVLPNGLTVLSEYMPGVRSVAFGTWVRAASIHEPRERMGVSHLLEHMVFKGTERRSAKEIALSLEALGGSLDAFTAREHTSYQARVLDEHLEQAADVIGDLVFRPLLRREDLHLERRVVLEEISMVEDTPDDLVFEMHNEALWGAHPYGYSILGTRETVSSLGVPELRELHARAYHPPQLVVAASGNVLHEDMLDVLDRTGWSMVERGDAAPLAAVTPSSLPPSVRHVPREGAQTHIVVGSTTVAHADPRRYALILASTVLGGGMSSRLFQRVREEMGLAYSVFTFQNFHMDTGVHGVYVGTAPDRAEQAMTAIREEFDRVSSEGLAESEIEAGKSQLKGQVTLSLESPSSRMYRAAGVELYAETYRTLDEILAAIDRITADDVLSVCGHFFDPTRQTVLSLGPSPAAESFAEAS